MADPSMPTYSTGTIALNSETLSEVAASKGVGYVRTVGVRTSNAEWNNWALSANIVVAKFPGLQS